MNRASWPLSCSWPTKSSSRCGRSERSSSSSPGRAAGTWTLTSRGRRRSCRLHGRAQRGRDQLLGRGVSPAAARGARRASPPPPRGRSRARRGPRARARAAPAPPARAAARAASSPANTLAQLDDHALGRLLADPGHDLEALRVAGRDRRAQLRDARARERRERHLRPDAGDRDQPQEQLALARRSRSRRGGCRRRAGSGGSAGRLAGPRPAPARASGRRR